MRPLREYYVATDPIDIAGTGHMSICKDCIEALFNRYYSSEGSLDKAIYKLCRIVNTKYDGGALDSTRKHIITVEEKGKAATGIFGIYRKGLVGGGNDRFGSTRNEDLSFQEGVKYDAAPLSPDEFDLQTIDGLETFWGKKLTPQQYQFLENEMARYRKTHKCDTAAEESLLRQICFTELEIREARENSDSVSGAIETLQKLMKTASVDPAKTAMAGSGKSQDTFSAFIKTIEENEPADYYKDKELFKDFDKIDDKYFKKYVTRPLKNFITQSRDFNVEQDEVEDDDFDIREVGEG